MGGVGGTSGAEWCIKALHPADPLCEVRGIPDHSAVPSVLMNYQMTTTISSPLQSGTWSFDGTLLPHPVNFMTWYATNGTTGDAGTVLNEQLTGTEHAMKYEYLKSIAQRWRLAYCSATVYQDGPDLANQGEIVVGQAIVQPRRTHVSTQILDAGGLSRSFVSAVAAESYTDEDLPKFETVQAMPNAFFSRSRDGAYVPLKLTETCQDWVSEADDVALTNLTSADALSYVKNAWLGVPYQSAVDTTDVWPHYRGGDNDLVPLSMDDGNPMALGKLHGQCTSKMLGACMAHICARNMSYQSSLAIHLRFGIEMQVHPSSPLAPQAKLSPGHDAAALDSYFRIARELKDAYPASYNSVGKLWDVISNVAQTVLPKVKSIPFLRGAGQVAEAALFVGDSIRGARKAAKSKRKAKTIAKYLVRNPTTTTVSVPQDKNPPSLAAVQRAQEVLSAKSVVGSLPNGLRIVRTSK